MVEPQLLNPYAIQSHYAEHDSEITSHEADQRAAYTRANKTVTYSQDPPNTSLATVALIAGTFALPTLALLSVYA